MNLKPNCSQVFLGFNCKRRVIQHKYIFVNLFFSGAGVAKRRQVLYNAKKGRRSETMFEKLTDTFVLNNGVHVPCVGFGTWQTPSGETAKESVRAAIAAGYRHIDTAAAYPSFTVLP